MLAAFESVERHMQTLSETKPNSSKQKGAGLRLKIENTRAMAVSAFSPPDNR